MPDPIAARTLLEPRALATYSGAVTTVFVITNGLHYAFGFEPRIVGLVVSIAVSIAGVLISDNHSYSQWAVCVPNGFLIYCAAVGVSSMTGSSTNSRRRRRQRSGEQIEELLPANRFLRSWY